VHKHNLFTVSIYYTYDIDMN